MFNSNSSFSDLPFDKIIAISNRKLCGRPFIEQIERVCKLHPSAVILREKDLTSEEYEKLAQNVLDICKKHDVTCIFHFFWESAIKMQVDKIHLPLWKLRELSLSELTHFKEIGVSIHSPEEALEAVSLGATYVTAGHIFVTDCKKGLAPRGLEFLKKVCDLVTIPVYGIGGIHLNSEQIKTTLDNGAAGVCIMSEMMHI